MKEHFLGGESLEILLDGNGTIGISGGSGRVLQKMEFTVTYKDGTSDILPGKEFIDGGRYLEKYNSIRNIVIAYNYE